MTAWKLTDGLSNLRSQLNAAFPNRDHESDGTIGDAAHQAEISGHNPDDTRGSKAAWNGDSDTIPEVRAFDCDSDFRTSGVTAQKVVDHVRALPGVSGVIRYMIYNRKMYHVNNGYRPTAYNGASAHTEHIHFEGAWTQAADNNTTFNYRLRDLLPAAAKDDDVNVDQLVKDNNAGKAGTVAPDTELGKLAMSQQVYDPTTGKLAMYYVAFNNLGKVVVDQAAQIKALSAKLDQAVSLLTELAAK
jgi:hypothetical protein